jgi:taurine--2-oxoglutarate transaminase
MTPHVLADRPMTAEEIVALSKKHTIFEWSAQAAVDPIPVSHAKGCYFFTPDGRRFLDFNSQLMAVNIGHGDERVIAAMHEQAKKLQYVAPSRASEPRARLGAKLAELAPGDIDVFFFTNGGADAVENAVKLARFYTGRHKIMARYRSYHGGTYGGMTLTGDPRRWANEPGIPGVVRVLDPYHGIQRGWDDAATSLAMIEETIQLEGSHTIAAFILESVVGTNGILIPPPGYMEGVRRLCDKYGILMIADEVMAGFGRTGRWFAIEHWNVVPDLITMAKGLTSAYLPLGAVGMRQAIADHFRDKAFYGGLTYGNHPVGCATALATIAVYEEDNLLENTRRMGALMTTMMQEMTDKHPCVGATRNIGLFGIFELVKNRSTLEPLAPFNGTSPEMAALNKALRAEGLYTFVRWNTFFTNPPLCINEAELREGFAAIDKALTVVDGMLEGASAR